MFLGRWYLEKRTAALLGVAAVLVLGAAAFFGLPLVLGSSSTPQAGGEVAPLSPTGAIQGGGDAASPAITTPAAPVSGASTPTTSPTAGGLGTPAPEATPSGATPTAPSPAVTTVDVNGMPVPIPSGSPTVIGDPPLEGATLPPELTSIAVPVGATPEITAESTAAIIWGQAVLIATKTGAQTSNSVSDDIIEKAAAKLSSPIAVWEAGGNRITISLPNGTANWYVCAGTGPQQTACGSTQ